MADFRQLSQFKVDADQAVEYVLPFDVGAGAPAVLLLAPADETNQPYRREQLRRAKRPDRLQRAKVGLAAVTQEVIDDLREEARDLFARYVVRGWKNVVDASGQPVAFSAENCLDFLKFLPNDVFDAIREFATEMSNFRRSSVEALAKNSESGSSGSSASSQTDGSSNKSS